MNKFNIKYVDKLSGRQFEFYCGWLFRLFLNTPNPKNVVVTPATNDHGADVLVKDDKNNVLIAFQCKHLRNPYQNRISYKALEETAAGKEYYHAIDGALITNSFVSKRTKKDAKHMGIEIFNRRELINIINRVAKDIKIPGYSMIRITKNDIVSLKAMQEVMGFTNCSNLIQDMINLFKRTHLNTTKTMFAYNGIRNSIIRLLKIKDNNCTPHNSSMVQFVNTFKHYFKGNRIPRLTLYRMYQIYAGNHHLQKMSEISFYSHFEELMPQAAVKRARYNQKQVNQVRAILKAINYTYPCNLYKKSTRRSYVWPYPLSLN